VTNHQSLVLAGVGIATCWGAFAFVWSAGAIYNSSHGPGDRTRTTFVPVTAVVLILAWGLFRVVPHEDWHPVTVQAAWVRFLGLAVLAVATAFTLWARLVLGRMWSATPTVKQKHELRTSGPYGITRHPIYTGILGMLLGTALLVGIGEWVVIFPVSLVLVEVKIHQEERLMLATFPDDYQRYRQRVPQLIPGLRIIHRPRAADA
jgi:protein-S-isoprenylcysteine O-methyltransferase Ste14